MSKNYYTREILENQKVRKGTTPYASIKEAREALVENWNRGGVIKGWIEDDEGHPVMLDGDVAKAKFGKGK